MARTPKHRSRLQERSSCVRVVLSLSACAKIAAPPSLIEFAQKLSDLREVFTLRDWAKVRAPSSQTLQYTSLTVEMEGFLRRDWVIDRAMRALMSVLSNVIEVREWFEPMESANASTIESSMVQSTKLRDVSGEVRVK